MIVNNENISIVDLNNQNKRNRSELSDGPDSDYLDSVHRPMIDGNESGIYDQDFRDMKYAIDFYKITMI